MTHPPETISTKTAAEASRSQTLFSLFLPESALSISMEPGPAISQENEYPESTACDNSQTPAIELSREISKAVEAIATTAMPFGKYGPKMFPPDGMPLYDLPLEYLHWFAGKGFPTGRLGRLMHVVYQLKCEGSDSIFDPLREPDRGRRRPGKNRRRSFQFE